MRMALVRTTGEYYRVAFRGGNAWGELEFEGPFALIPDAVERAMRMTLERKVTCYVERVTTHQPHESPGLDSSITTETVTGRIRIPGPHSFGDDPQLTRNQPGVGWVMPEYIDPNEIGVGDGL